METHRIGILCAKVTMTALLLLPCSMARGFDFDTANDEQAADDGGVPEKGPPLPFHSIEGYGGGAITPMAYLVNPPQEGQIFGKPALAMSYVNLARKNLDAITVTENVFGRFELGYGADRLGLGTLASDIQDKTAKHYDIRHSDVWLHSFNVRTLLVKENSDAFELPLPAITLGTQIKYNGSIADINSRLEGALSTIGYAKDTGADFTLTFTKTFPKLLSRPLIVTAGLRESQAANLGFLGFGDTYRATFEGNVAYVLRDNIILAYEFRQKQDPYTLGLAPLINGEDDWHAFDVGIVLNNHSTLVAGYGVFGTLANSEANSAWWLQFKYEF